MIAKNEGVIVKAREVVPKEYGPTEIFVWCKGDAEESFLKSFYGAAYDFNVNKLVGMTCREARAVIRDYYAEE